MRIYMCNFYYTCIRSLTLMRWKILIFLGFAGCCLVACTSRTEVSFVYVDPLDKVLPEQVLFYPYDASVDVCRGEYATLQFVVRSPERIDDLKASIKGTFPENTLTLHAEQAQLSYVGYVHEGRTVPYPASDLLYSTSRFYPDPLICSKSVDVEPNVNVILWVSMPIPLNTIPGSYSFEITVRGKGRFVRTLPFKINVYSPQVSEQTLLIDNWFYPEFLSQLVPKNSMSDSMRIAALEKMATIMNTYRQNVIQLSPVLLGSYTFGEDGEVDQISLENFGKTLQIFAKQMDLKLVAGAHLAKRTQGWEESFQVMVPFQGDNKKTYFKYLPIEDQRVKQFYNRFLDSLISFLTRNGWKEKYVQHIADEPIDANSVNYIELARYVRSKMPGIRIIEALQTERVVPDVDILVPQLDYLHKKQDYFRLQQEQGKELWFYTSRLPQGEYANRHIRQPLLKTRLLHWINYKYGLTGYLHWGYNYWLSTLPELETSGIQVSGHVLPGGDCWIVYPQGDSILPSIRLEAMRDGIVDYELLTMAACKDSALVHDIVGQVVYDFDRYDLNIVRFRQMRRKVLEILSQ